MELPTLGPKVLAGQFSFLKIKYSIILGPMADGQALARESENSFYLSAGVIATIRPKLILSTRA